MMRMLACLSFVGWASGLSLGRLQEHDAALNDTLKRYAVHMGSVDRYLWFPLHSGMSNQLLAVKVALMLGAVLNRTVVLPPIHDHHALAYGDGRKAFHEDLNCEFKERLLLKSQVIRGVQGLF